LHYFFVQTTKLLNNYALAHYLHNSPAHYLTWSTVCIFTDVENDKQGLRSMCAHSNPFTQAITYINSKVAALTSPPATGAIKEDQTHHEEDYKKNEEESGQAERLAEDLRHSFEQLLTAR
jgi:hypothetical protein